jgi:hypothetical protein
MGVTRVSDSWNFISPFMAEETLLTANDMQPSQWTGTMLRPRKSILLQRVLVPGKTCPQLLIPNGEEMPRSVLHPCDGRWDDAAG